MLYLKTHKLLGFFWEGGGGNKSITCVYMQRYYIDSAISTGFLVGSSSANNQNPSAETSVFSSLLGNVQIFARCNNSKSRVLCTDNN